MKGSFTPMPIPFPEALRDRLAPVFNGTVPLERKKDIITNRPHSRHRSSAHTLTDISIYIAALKNMIQYVAFNGDVHLNTFDLVC